jgi:iron complex outermembrane receptor protein
VSVITADEIRRYGYTTLGDVLRSVRGFYVSNNRNYSFAGTRGFNRPGDFNSRVLIMIDGHRINDNVYGQGGVSGELTLDVDLIERVEVIRGPGSSLYGTGAFFGVINVIPKRGSDFNGAELAAGVGGGNSRTFIGRTSAGKKFDNGAEALVPWGGYDSTGQKTLFHPEFAGNTAFNNGYALNAEGERWDNVYGSLHYGGFTLTVSGVQRKKILGGGLYQSTFNDPGNFTWDKHEYVDLQYQRDFTADTSAHVRLYSDRYSYNADAIYDVPPRVTNKDYGKGNWWGGEARLMTRIAERHRVTLGAEYVNNSASDQRNFDQSPFNIYNYAPYRFSTAAIYLQDEISLNKQ